VQPGDVMGVIGRNGAGKSTLLKLLSRISEPTEGRAVIRGRVASLLEVGTGFHNELSGRENIFLNGAILGMPKSEIVRKFDEIVEFSGVGKFLDTPIKRYSSGMKVRLAFAVAAHLEPEILIIDEVLAVGDVDFQNKCMGKMQDVATSGRTVLFVSHNLGAIESLCTRAILLTGGRLTAQGTTNVVLQKYMQESSCTETFQKETGYVRRVRVLDQDRQATGSIPVGQDAIISIDLAPCPPREDIAVTATILNSLGQRVVTCVTRHQMARTIQLDRELTLDCRIHDLRLTPGLYSLTIFVWAYSERIEQIDPCIQLEISTCDLYGTGLIPVAKNAMYLPHATWNVQDSTVR